MLQAFTTWSDELGERLDPYYYSEQIKSFRNKLSSHNTKLLGDLINHITKGETPLWRGDSYVDEGIPFLKVQNISPDGLIGDMTFISEAVDKRMKRSQLFGGELLYTMAGTIGIATIYPKNYGRANINQAIAKIIVKDDVDIEYLKIILNSEICKMQSKILVTAVAQPNINFEQIKSLRIPYPDADIRKKIIDIVNNAYNLKKQKGQKGQELLFSIDGYILDKLGISIDSSDNSKTFTVWSDEIDSRIDPSYFHPNRRNTIKAIKNSKYKLLPLEQVVKFQREIVTELDEGLPYIGLENIVSNTGEYLEISTKTSLSSAFSFHANNVLFPKLRPYLNKVYYAEFSGMCSTEFHVMEAIQCDPCYLYAFLSSNIVVMQTYYLMTGNTLPRLQTADIEKLLIPIPTSEVQQKIATEVRNKKNEARTLLQEADKSIKEANKQIEQMILGA